MPITLPGYNLGDKGKPDHFNASTTREQAAIEAKVLALGDAAFIKRSDLTWTYALITERVEDKNGVVLRFEVDKDKNRKSFPQAQWGKYIRVITVVETSEEATVDEKSPTPATDAASAEEKKEDTVEEKEKETPAVEEEEKKEESPKVEQKKEEPSKAQEKEEETPRVQEVKVEKKEEKEAPAVEEKKEQTSAATDVITPLEGQGIEVEAPKAVVSGDGKSKKPYSTWLGNSIGNMFGSSSSKKRPGTPSENSSTVPKSEEPVVVDVSNSKEPVVANAPKPEEPVVADAPNPSKPVVGDASKPSKPVVADPPKPPEPVVADSLMTSIPWLGNVFGSSGEPVLVDAPKSPKPVAAETKITDPVVKETKSSQTLVDKKEEPVAPTPTPLPAVNEDNESKENSAPAPISTTASLASNDKDRISSPKSFLPLTSKQVEQVKKATEQCSVSSKSSSKSALSMKRKNSFKSAPSSFLSKITGKKKTVPKPEETKVSIVLPTVSPAAPPPRPEKKEWFDRDASECDYDKNPTDLFQALEARQFSYADDMLNQASNQFTKECKTWVVARAQKKSKESSTQLRFRALPLHAALVFGAPDDMVKKILTAYPRATRGRDVKGRLPIHLAYEHNASDDVVQMVLEAFPRGALAKDKKEMTPLDYISAVSDRVVLKNTISLILSAKMEEERAKFDEEKTAAIACTKSALQQDPVFLEGIVSTVTEDIEQTYASKMELLERNYQKEIEMLKKKHDSETQALLEGFEVKLNFEKKLNRLKKAKA